MKKRAALYMRVSSDRQREKTTIQSQKDILPKVARDQGFKIVGTYIDDGISGETIEDRPGFMQLLSDAEDKKFDAVFVIDLDRLSRATNQMQTAYIHNVMRQNGITLHTPYQQLDLTNEDDDMMAELFAMLAKREKNKIKSRTSRGRIASWKRGKHAHGTVPFGYRDEEGKYVIEPSEARIIRLIYDLALSGMGSESICNELNARGEPTPTEMRERNARRVQTGWAKTTVRRFLSQKTYYGDLFVGIRTREGKKTVMKPKSEWIKIDVPPIVTRAEYDQVRELAKKNQTFSGNYKRVYLLSHLIRCGECGASLVGEDSSGRGYYICYSRRKRKTCDLPWQHSEELDRAVWKSVERLLCDPDFLKKQIQQSYHERITSLETGLTKDKLEKLIAKKVVERDGMLRLFRRGKIDDDALDKQLSDIDREEAILKKNLEHLKNREKHERKLARSLNQIDTAVREAKGKITSLGLKERQKVLQLLTYTGRPNIVIHKNGEIELYGLLDFENAENLAPKIAEITRL